MAKFKQDFVSLLTHAKLGWQALYHAYQALDTRTHHIAGILLKIVVAVYFLFCMLFLTARYVVWLHSRSWLAKSESSIVLTIDCCIEEVS